MSYTVSWYIPDEILYLHYSGAITAEELRKSLMEMQSFIESSPRALVHSIHDAGDVSEFPSMKNSIEVIRDASTHPRTGWSLSIREKSTLMKLGSTIGASLFKARFRAFDTLEQAITHLKSVDENLSWDKVAENFTES